MGSGFLHIWCLMNWLQKEVLIITIEIIIIILKMYLLLFNVNLDWYFLSRFFLFISLNLLTPRLPANDILLSKTCVFPSSHCHYPSISFFFFAPENAINIYAPGVVLLLWVYLSVITLSVTSIKSIIIFAKFFITLNSR